MVRGCGLGWSLDKSLTQNDFSLILWSMTNVPAPSDLTDILGDLWGNAALGLAEGAPFYAVKCPTQADAQTLRFNLYKYRRARERSSGEAWMRDMLLRIEKSRPNVVEFHRFTLPVFEVVTPE